MYSVTRSFGLNGLSGFAVAVEADISGGLPAFSIVGLPDSAVRESADRVRAAIKNLGFKFPDRRITINLAPADVRKTGPVYALPLLLALLTASGQIEEVSSDTAFLGELALDGVVESREYYGLYIKYYINVEGQTLKVIEKNDGVNIYEPDQKVSVVINPSHVMAYEASEEAAHE